MVLGTAALLALAAVLALAIGTIVRRGTSAVARVIVVIFIPYLSRSTRSPRRGKATAPAEEEAGSCRSPQPPPWPYSRRSPSSISLSAYIPGKPGTTRWHRGPGWRWSARGRPPRWRWRTSWCGGGTHEPAGRVAPPRYRPGEALHAEWTKFRTVAARHGCWPGSSR